MGKFLALPFIAGVMLMIGGVVSVVSLPLSWAEANAEKAKVHYNFYLLGWDTDFCLDDNGDRHRFSYDTSFEFKDLKGSGLAVLICTIIACVLSFIVGFYYILHSIGPTKKCLKKIKLNVGRRTWILLIMSVICLAVNIVGMVLWLALFYSNSVSEWIASASCDPYVGFYIELVSIVLSAVGILIGMFWKHS